MKKIFWVILILLIIAIVVLVLLFLGPGLGLGTGSGKGSGTDEGDGITRNVIVVQEAEAEATYVAQTSTESGNLNEIQYIKVTISEGDYFFDNEKIKLDDLVLKLKSTEGDYIVEVIDELATKNAYDNLIDALDSNRIDFVEKNH